MPDYRYYVETYLGEDILEADFPRLIRRAQAELARMRDVYAVQPRPAWTPAEADAMAVCAVADAMYEFDQEDAARGLAKGDRGQRERDLHRTARAVRRHPGAAGRALPPRGRVLPAD